MNNITIKKIWHDLTENFCEICISVSTEKVSVTEKYYVDDKKLLKLSDLLKDFAEYKIKSFDWESGKKGKGYVPDIEIKGFWLDKSGHFRFEIYMELDDHGNEKIENHFCRFYVDGIESNVLINFAVKIPYLQVGDCVGL